MPRFRQFLLAAMDDEMCSALTKLQVEYTFVGCSCATVQKVCIHVHCQGPAFAQPMSKITHSPDCISMQPGEDSQHALFPYFAQFVLEHYMADIKAYRSVFSVASHGQSSRTGVEGGCLRVV
jgi:hypothetical protein